QALKHGESYRRAGNVQINSSEDDLRTPFRQSRRRARQLARHGVGALQLVGWNAGGQDRGNPSHSPESWLGTWEELKEAIAEIEAMGIRVVLFNKSGVMATKTV